MKKLLLIGAILAGAVTASQAGVNFSIGIGIPAPVPHSVVISHPAPVYCPPPVVVAPCPPPVISHRPWAPVVVAPPHHYGHGHGHRHGHRHSYRYEERWRHNGRGEHYSYRERWR